MSIVRMENHQLKITPVFPGFWELQIQVLVVSVMCVLLVLCLCVLPPGACLNASSPCCSTDIGKRRSREPRWKTSGRGWHGWVLFLCLFSISNTLHGTGIYAAASFRFFAELGPRRPRPPGASNSDPPWSSQHSQKVLRAWILMLVPWRSSPRWSDMVMAVNACLR